MMKKIGYLWCFCGANFCETHSTLDKKEKIRLPTQTPVDADKSSCSTFNDGCGVRKLRLHLNIVLVDVSVAGKKLKTT